MKITYVDVMTRVPVRLLCRSLAFYNGKVPRQFTCSSLYEYKSIVSFSFYAFSLFEQRIASLKINYSITKVLSKIIVSSLTKLLSDFNT